MGGTHEPQGSTQIASLKSDAIARLFDGKRKDERDIFEIAATPGFNRTFRTEFVHAILRKTADRTLLDWNEVHMEALRQLLDAQSPFHAKAVAYLQGHFAPAEGQTAEIMIDEVQDTTVERFQLFQQLHNFIGRGVLVGDPRQNVNSYQETIAWPDFVALADKVHSFNHCIR